MIAADDFTLPAALASCDSLTVDIGLMRAVGRTPGPAGNARVPTSATFWLWADPAVQGNQTFMQAAPAALATLVSTQPSEPASPTTWASPPQSGFGYWLPAGNVYVETLRFALGSGFAPLLRNLGGATARRFWLGLDVALTQAWNTTPGGDYSQNQPRWMLQGDRTSSACRAASLTPRRCWARHVRDEPGPRQLDDGDDGGADSALLDGRAHACLCARSRSSWRSPSTRATARGTQR